MSRRSLWALVKQQSVKKGTSKGSCNSTTASVQMKKHFLPPGVGHTRPHEKRVDSQQRQPCRWYTSPSHFLSLCPEQQGGTSIRIKCCPTRGCAGPTLSIPIRHVSPRSINTHHMLQPCTPDARIRLWWPGQTPARPRQPAFLLRWCQERSQRLLETSHVKVGTS